MIDTNLYRSVDFTSVASFTDGAEGPGVDRSGNLYAVNFARQQTIGRVTPEGESSIFLELPGGSCGNGIRFDRAGAMYIADYTNHNVLRVDMAQCARATSLAERNAAIQLFTHEPTMNQPNDLAIMANDILFASDPNWPGSWGQIWRVDPTGQVTLLETGMGTTNGIEVSPDELTLYVNETVQQRVWAYDLSPRGEISNKRLFHQFPDHWLDGMRCDTTGNLYVTRWGKGVIAKLAPNGELLQEIPLNGQKCTNIAFGGPDGCTAYVTVADRGNIETFRVEHPGREWQLAQRNGS
ncbi:MAG TPA: SMP-30/gluconolactonase/LRE family protein [Caldilineaceae bacterium]|nr:SMP-30/gluconolactonase/LRE family protein [Caldilineaceae bacterium]